MTAYTVTRGLDLPIAGAPAQRVHPARAVRELAVLPSDLRGFRPRLQVQVGDTVAAGQVLYQDRTFDAIRVVAPAAGRIAHIHRGERRIIQSVVIDTSVSPDAGGSSPFSAWSSSVGRDRATLRELLLESGLWTALRTRPFSQVPKPDGAPDALFVTAMDTQPLAPDVDVIVGERESDFATGLAALTVLTDAPVFVCRKAGSSVGNGVRGVELVDFAGKHPAGTVGYHIHTLAPVSRTHSAWHLGAQDVIRIGHLIKTGMLDATQVVALGGPLVREPRLVRTQLGSPVLALVDGELIAAETDPRIVSGSVLTGVSVTDNVTGYLGRFHQQITVLPEGRPGAFLGWMSAFTSSYTHLPIYISSWMNNRGYAFDTRLHGGHRAMVPIGAYERVMPMDIMPTHLLRAITIGDTEWSEELGALELDEEDVALCSYVCAGKQEYGAALRNVLDQLAGEQ